MTQAKGNQIIAVFMENMETAIVSKYRYYLIRSQNMHCKQLRKTIDKSDKIVFHANWLNIHKACKEMKKDIIFLTKRRTSLIDELRPSFGKIAGIIAYRLAKSHIIHLCEGCANCKTQSECLASRLNSTIALQCAWTYVGIQYHRIPEEIRKELFYTFSFRHVNQETLGLVFDMAYAVYPKLKV